MPNAKGCATRKTEEKTEQVSKNVELTDVVQISHFNQVLLMLSRFWSLFRVSDHYTMRTFFEFKCVGECE